MDSFSDSDTPEVGSWVTKPRDIDVASTKIRSWASHPGNVFYRTLIDQYVNTGAAGQKTAAERIVNIIMVDRKGLFLRSENGGTRWLVMDRKSALAKVTNAIRNQQVKNATGSWKTTKKHSKEKKKANATPVYQALAGNGTRMSPYALLLITAACNKKSLDSPLSLKEGDQDRSIRLQLRQRYASAAAAGMSPLVFSKRLMEFLGGTLVEIPKQSTETVAPEGNGTTEAAATTLAPGGVAQLPPTET